MTSDAHRQISVPHVKSISDIAQMARSIPKPIYNLHKSDRHISMDNRRADTGKPMLSNRQSNGAFSLNENTECRCRWIFPSPNELNTRTQPLRIIKTILDPNV